MPRPPRRPAARSQRSLQRKGALIALALASCSIGIIGYFVVRGSPQPAPAPEPEPQPLGQLIRPGDALIPGQAGGADKVRITLVDKEDPGRRAGLVIIDALDPVEGQLHVREAMQPQAWLYLKDGRMLHIRADKGRLYMPDQRSAPESGSISGNVLIRTFEGRSDGELPDLETAIPVSTFSTQTIEFDSALGEAVSHDPFEYLHPGVAHLRAVGFKIIMNEAQQRLERLLINEGRELAVWQPDRQEKTEPARASQTAARPERPAGASPPPQTPPAKPVETTYVMKFAGDVQVLHGASRITGAESLHIWARLLDNKLPENAIRQVRMEGSGRDAPLAAAAPLPSASAPARAEAGTIKPETSPTTEAGAQRGSTLAAAAATEPDLVLRWSGPCTIDLTPPETPELKANHLAMRFSAGAAEGVQYSEARQGFSGSAATIDYGLTRAVLAMAGAEPASARGAVLNSGRGRIDVGALSYDLSTGIAHIPTGGKLLQGETESIQWSRQADVQFEVRDGAATSDVRQAAFQGNIQVALRDGAAEAEFARADFVTSAQRGSLLTRVLMEGAARITSSDGGYLAGDKLDISFAPDDKGDPDPRVLTATGNVEAGRGEQRLNTQFLEAMLARNPGNAIDVQSVLARGEVRFADAEDRIGVAADELRADLSWTNRLPSGELAQKQTIELTGGDVTLTKDDRTTIGGTQVRIDGLSRSLQVFGAGRFQHSDAREKPVSILATWSRGMMFDNTAGTIECDGDAMAIATREQNQRDTLRSERLKLWIEPEGASMPREGALAAGEGERRLLRAEAIGGVLIKDGGANASIESRQIAVDDAGGQRTSQLYYLEGPRILADRIAQTLTVPAAGRMLLLDQRPESPSESEPQPAAFGPASARGTALMDWDGQLHMDRNAGTMDARQNVRLTHRALDESGTITNLLAERVIARMRELAAGSEENLRAELVSATATGAVYVTSGPEITPSAPRPQTKELVADQVEYNALQRTLTATAAAGNQVSLFDPKHPVPATAASLFWDLGTDRVEVREPGPISAPRSTSSR